MAEINIIRPKLTDYQKKILYSPARYTITEASTKAGKSYSHLWWLFEKSSSPPKPGANYWWIAPVYSQSEIAFTRLNRFLGGSSDFIVNRSRLSVESPTSSVLQFKSAENPDNLYGEDVYAAVFDEFTRAKEEAWYALRSTLTKTEGPCKFIGNAKGKKNWGYKLGVKARAGEPGYEYHRVTAYDAIEAGILKAEEVEQAKRDLPEHVFRELYLAEALDDKSNPFGIPFLQKSIRTLSTKPAVAYGVDLAKSVDWTVILGLDIDGVPCFYDRFQADWAQTKQRIIRQIGQIPVFIDSTGVGDAIVEEISRVCRNAEGYKFTSQSKQIIMEGLVASIQSSKTFILAEEYEEFESFEFEYSKSGVVYTAPPGMHDDIVCAHALAEHKRKEKRSTTTFAPTFYRT